MKITEKSVNEGRNSFKIMLFIYGSTSNFVFNNAKFKFTITKEGYSAPTYNNVKSDSANANFAYAGTSRIELDYFNILNNQTIVRSTTREYSGMRATSIDEITLSDKRAKYSDFAAFLMGSNGGEFGDYWTRDLGTDLGEGKIIRASGRESTRWLDRMYGIRMSYTMSEGSSMIYA